MYGRILIIPILFATFISCNPNQEYESAKTLAKRIMLTNLTKNYKLSIDNYENRKISFSNKLKKRIIAGDQFYFRTNTPIYVENLEILNQLKKKPHQSYYYKLYINNKLKGKFKVAEKLKINKEISSIRILFLKTKSERLVNGWSGNNIFKFLRIKDSNKNIFSPKINLWVKSKVKIDFETFHPREIHNKKSLFLNKKLLKSITNNNILIINGLHYRKNSSNTLQYSIRMSDSGFFSLYQLLSNNTKKKIVHELFFEGNWECTNLNNNYAKIEFNGKLSGYFPNKKQNFIHNEQVIIKSTLIGKKLKSNMILDEIYLDFPDDAFVNVQSLIPDINVDMAYASKNNFIGEKLYPCNKCFLRYEVGKALMKAQSILKKKQMGLKLFDCYRPFSVQAIMFKKFPIPGYVADSIGGSVHNRGSAVDLSIIDKNGNALDMGTEFDELSPKSNHNYLYFSDTILKNRLYLKNLMQSCNFTAIRSEWWHYNYLNARKFQKVNDEFLCN